MLQCFVIFGQILVISSNPDWTSTFHYEMKLDQRVEGQSGFRAVRRSSGEVLCSTKMYWSSTLACWITTLYVRSGSGLVVCGTESCGVILEQFFLVRRSTGAALCSTEQCWSSNLQHDVVGEVHSNKTSYLKFFSTNVQLFLVKINLFPPHPQARGGGGCVNVNHG